MTELEEKIVAALRSEGEKSTSELNQFLGIKFTSMFLWDMVNRGLLEVKKVDREEKPFPVTVFYVKD